MLSAIRVDRSLCQLLREVSSSSNLQGISHHCSGSDRIEFCLSRRSRSCLRFPLLPSLSRQSIAVAAGLYQSATANDLVLCQTEVYAVAHRLEIGGGTLQHRLRLPRLPTFSDIPGVACRIERKCHTSPLLASPTARYPFHAIDYPYRFTCSHYEYGVVVGLNSGAVWQIFSAISSLCLESFEERCEPSHFSSRKGRADRSTQNSTLRDLLQ